MQTGVQGCHYSRDTRHEIDSAPGYRLKYSDGFYNMQGEKGYGIVDLYVDRTWSTIDHFEVTLRT